MSFEKLFDGTYVNMESIQAVKPIYIEEMRRTLYVSFEIVLNNATISLSKRFSVPESITYIPSGIVIPLGDVTSKKDISEYDLFLDTCVKSVDEELQKLINKILKS